MAQIDDAQLLRLQQAEALLSRLHSNKETKRDLERMAKKVNPNAITIDDQLDPYLSDVKSELNDLREWKKEMEGRVSTYNKDQQVSNLRKSGYTPEGIKAIEEIMEKEGIKSYDVAAAYWDKVRPSEPAAPNGISPSMWNFGKDETEEDTKLLQTNDDLWLDRKTAQIMDEIKRGRA